ncbi:hypothetical protein BH09ACT1_BH09ACT1_07690 [soil metagenome]|uniref:hypothetical protein n=1 Tax=Frigoribacterium sp. UYMn621 TaxID=3156343 RepID=UPI0033991C5E
MPLAPDAAALAALLPGTWRIGATNFPMWLRGDRLRPYFRYDLRTADPLVLDDVVGYTTADGVEKTIVGVDRMRHDGFVWRGAGLLRFVTSRWAVAGATEDSNILVIRFAKSRLSPAGVDVVVREGTDSLAFRTQVAGLSESLGLTHGEFASLTWLELAD